MQVVECAGFGGIEVLKLSERALPQLQCGEVLIRVRAAGINRPDLLQRRGKYPPPVGASDVLGLEVSGEIVAVGEKVERWQVGDKVCALLAGGGYAEFAVAPEGQCLPVPEKFDLAAAALLPETVFTVWANLFESGRLKAGETVLVHGGAGGIGSTAIQMAKAAGAFVVATAGDQQKVAACYALGADKAICYAEQDFVSETMEFVRQNNRNGAKAGEGAAPKGVDVVLDLVGGPYVARNLACLAPFGRHVSVAAQAGKMAEIDISLIMSRQITLTGSTLRPRSVAEKSRLAAEIEKNVWPWLRAGKLKPLIFKFFEIKNVAEAHKVMETGANIGKIGLEVGA